MAYKYLVTENLKKLLPGHYIQRCLEFQNARPTPVHWLPHPGKYRANPKTGERLRVQDVPIPVIYPKEANEGLWGGEGLIQGLIKRKPMGKRIPKLWRPFLTKRLFYSEILDRWMAITVTQTTLDKIDESYGFDNYILKTPEWDLNSKLGMDLKREMLLALVRRSFYPGNGEKQEEICEKYTQLMIPEEEAEWVGLSIKEAVIKARELEAKKSPIVPMKELFAKELVQKLREDKLTLVEDSSGWFSKLNPFGGKSESENQTTGKQS